MRTPRRASNRAREKPRVEDAGSNAPDSVAYRQIVDQATRPTASSCGSGARRRARPRAAAEKDRRDEDRQSTRAPREARSTRYEGYASSRARPMQLARRCERGSRRKGGTWRRPRAAGVPAARGESREPHSGILPRTTGRPRVSRALRRRGIRLDRPRAAGVRRWLGECSRAASASRTRAVRPSHSR